MGKALFGRFYATSGLLFAILLMICISSAWAIQGQDVATVYAVGNGTIHGADMSAVRNAAIADSQVAAVTQVLNELLSPEVVAGYFQVLSESILSNTDRYINNYDMLAEATHGKTHRVMVKATVGVQGLKNALKHAGIYVGRKPLPKVLYCIAEKQVKDAGYHYWWNGQGVRWVGAAEETLMQMINSRGFSMVTPQMDAAMTAYPPELSVPEAMALARQMQAEVVVVGQAVVEQIAGTPADGSVSLRGAMAARAYNVSDGRQIGSSEHMTTVTGEDPALKGGEALTRAARIVGESLADQMTSAWYSQGAVSSQVEIAIFGLAGHMADFVKFRGVLSTMSGVDGIQRKEMQADSATLQVDFQGSAHALANSLMQQNFDGFMLDIAEPEGNVIRIQIVSR